MNIKEAAEKYGVSKQAIYQRLKNNGISIDKLKDQETGEFTAEGEGILYKLFGEQKEEVKQRRINLQEELTNAKVTISSLESKIDLLTVKLAAAERERDLYKETLEQERTLFNRFLPAPEDTSPDRPRQEKRPGLMKRLAAAIKGN